MTSSTRPALLGGKPERTTPYPSANFISAAERALVDEVLDSGVLSAYVAHEGPWFNGGRMVKALEAEFCERFGVAHAISVNSATSGLHAAVCAALAGLGDEVIVPPYTMSATATVIACTNATPVFADIRPDTFCIDVEDVKRKLSSRTRAIFAVNLFGGPAELAPLRELADKHGVILIEDNAQAPGGVYRGRPTGTWGHMGVFSFNCHKTIQCGEGGMVVTNDDRLADRLRLVRNHGEVVQAQREAVPPEMLGLLGYNYRLTELQSAIALAQTRRLEELTAPRIAIADLLSRELAKIPGVVPPFVAPENRHVYYGYAMRIDEQRLGLSRAQLKRALDAEGVQTAEGYVRPIYLYPMYDARVRAQRKGFGAGIWHPAEGSDVKYGPGACPVTERMHDKELLTTGICSAHLGEREAWEMIRAFQKAAEHASEIRAHLSGETGD
jgi:dTDP-4-amino-4,6-dideoxygalactose transaminase